MMNLAQRAGVQLTTHVKITIAVGPSIVFVFEIGCFQLQQQGGMFVLHVSVSFIGFSP